MIEILDEEWLALIKEAKQLGLNKDEVRVFLQAKEED
ncbi:anti-repressor SinI family protein [Cytobacillus sp. Sa5YUA1]|uniref:Anti-repressor SinI family protein n=1 Tax=Cytobacillus stercorigallinarum TaxID=2762240 RepID=A0ABR8QST5_9BACI|nr:anti-repressor SinI family protein [Cytobacillus stercorigallinarum]